MKQGSIKHIILDCCPIEHFQPSIFCWTENFSIPSPLKKYHTCEMRHPGFHLRQIKGFFSFFRFFRVPFRSRKKTPHHPGGDWHPWGDGGFPMIQILQAIRNGDFSHGEQEVRKSRQTKKLHKATKKHSKNTTQNEGQDGETKLWS